MIHENFLSPKVIWDTVEFFFLAQTLLAGLAMACVFAFRKPAKQAEVAEDQPAAHQSVSQMQQQTVQK